MADYERSIEDELDWSLLDQLHSVVLQIGTFCFRTKQICLTVLTAVVALIATFTADRLDHSIFVAAVVIPICFWILDSIAYFYQVKLRGMMAGIRDRVHNRHSEGVLRGPNFEVISNDRTDRPIASRFRDALFNHSMWLYLVLIIVDLILWRAFSFGIIQ